MPKKMLENQHKELNIKSQVADSPVGMGTAHGKVILMGEHAVVYDYPAIALPVPAVAIRVRVTPTQHQADYLSCRYYKGPLADAPQELQNVQAAISLAQEHCAPKNQVSAIHIRIDSDIPQERGMGSSAAVAVALVRALADYYGVSLTQEVLHYMVNKAEVLAHGAPSGLDTLMTSTTQPALYRKGLTPQAFQMNLGGYLVIADSGQAGQTKLAVAQVAQLAQDRPDQVMKTMAAIGECTIQAQQAIRQGDLVALGRLMTYNHYYLNQLKVSTPELDNIVKSAWLAGALGAKLTGGGLGGCVIALASHAQQAEAISQAMRQAGAGRTWTMAI